MGIVVNIHDVKTNKADWEGKCKLTAIFKRQEELMVKYHEIEKKNGLLQTEDCPVSLHDKFGQARLKDFAWRVTEELGEALDALEKHKSDGHDIDHCYEELADALHFLAEFSILAGIGPRKIRASLELVDNWAVIEDTDHLEGIFELVEVIFDRDTHHWVAEFVMEMGMACNCFKNKPWKQTHMVTDEDEFLYHLAQAWLMFITICKSVDLGPEELTAFYFGKSEVNRFRQRSNY